MRLIGGSRRGLRLDAPPGLTTRPTAERAREALFNILNGAAYRSRLIGRPVADFFAGTGAVGLEALSRGAENCQFLETDPKALAVLRANLARFKPGDTARILQADATRPPRPAQPCGMLFLDPPYTEDIAAQSLNAALGAGWLAEDGIVVVQLHPKASFALPDGVTLLDDRSYGAARFLILGHSAGGE